MKKILLILMMGMQTLYAKVVTNPQRSDGFGAQFQTIIYSVIYAELTNQRFCYTPFNSMEHNYDNDPDFLEKKERLINFIGNFELCDGNRCHVTPYNDMITFFEKHLETCLRSRSLAKIKKIFRTNKNRDDFYNKEKFNIAIHIRRPNQHDNRIEGTELLDDAYLSIINRLRQTFSDRNPLIHIFSQGDIESFKSIYGSDDVIFHINTPIEESFTSLVLADVLVTSTSSFSYTAGILSDGIVYYIPYWHPPLPHWIVFSEYTWKY